MKKKERYRATWPHSVGLYRNRLDKATGDKLCQFYWRGYDVRKRRNVGQMVDAMIEVFLSSCGFAGKIKAKTEAELRPAKRALTTLLMQRA